MLTTFRSPRTLAPHRESQLPQIPEIKRPHQLGNILVEKLKHPSIANDADLQNILKYKAISLLTCKGDLSLSDTKILGLISKIGSLSDEERDELLSLANETEVTTDDCLDLCRNACIFYRDKLHELNPLFERIFGDLINIECGLDLHEEVHGILRSYAGAHSLVEDHLQTLHFHAIKLLMKQAEEYTYEALPTCLPESLERLSFSESPLFKDSSTAVQLLELLGREIPLSNLTALDLSYNNIEGTEIKSLSSNLCQSQFDYHLMAKPLTSLKSILTKNQLHLILSYNYLGDIGIEAFIPCLPFSKITNLNLTDNEIGDRGAIALAAALHRSAIHTLTLDENPIGDAGAIALANAIPHNKLFFLSLNTTLIGAIGKEKLDQVKEVRDIEIALNSTPFTPTEDIPQNIPSYSSISQFTKPGSQTYVVKSSRVIRWEKIKHDVDIKQFEKDNENYSQLSDNELSRARKAHFLLPIENLLGNEYFNNTYVTEMIKGDGSSFVYKMAGNLNGVRVIFEIAIDRKKTLFHKYAQPISQNGIHHGRALLRLFDQPKTPTPAPSQHTTRATSEKYTYSYEPVSKIFAIESKEDGTRLELYPIRSGTK